MWGDDFARVFSNRGRRNDCLAARTPAVVEFGGTDGGKTASYVPRWVNTRGEPGPLSAIATATVGG